MDDDQLGVIVNIEHDSEVSNMNTISLVVG